MKLILNLYRKIFARKSLFKFNFHLNRLSQRSLGLLNSEGEKVTGEDYFIRWLAKNDNIKTFIDIGANTGNYTLLLNKYMPKTQIFAIEPHPKSFIKLKHNVMGIKNISIFNFGLDNKSGSSILWDFSTSSDLKRTQPTSTLATQYRDVIEKFHKQKSMSYNIRTTTLVEFIKQNNLMSVDLIQIDTEGSEYKILNKAKTLIKENKIGIIQFEFNEMNVYSRVFMKDYFELLDNYILFRLLPIGLLPLGKYKPDYHENFAFQNIIAINNKKTKLLSKI